MDILVVNSKVVSRKEDVNYVLFNPLNDERVVFNALWQTCQGVSKGVAGISQNGSREVAGVSSATIESLIAFGFLEVRP